MSTRSTNLQKRKNFTTKIYFEIYNSFETGKLIVFFQLNKFSKIGENRITLIVQIKIH